jgi:hypothetical protein
MKKQPKTKSSIIYNGPSLIDGKPIVVIAIVQSGNSKTGNMIQTHILRADISPLEASKTGADVSICGDCMHRGKPTDNPTKKVAEGRTCYVNLGQGPTVVYKAFQRGLYPIAAPEEITRIGSARMVRLGTYGDPAAVPATVWDALLKEAAGHTGYTHQHSSGKASNYKRLMYSADTAAEAQHAHNHGVRTFRVIPVQQWQEHGKTAMLPNEALCPASKEAGYKSTCNTCKLCSGSTLKAKSVAIVAHGTARNSVKG